MVKKKYIYDLFIRILHAGIGSFALLLFISGKLARIYYEYSSVRHNLWMVHIYLGYLLALFLGIRILLLVFGSNYAHLGNFIQLENWKKIIKTKKVIWDWGHHPFAGIAYLFVYAILGFLVYSGFYLARIQFDMGPINAKYFDEMPLLANFLENHEILSLLVLVFTIVHLAALFWHQTKDGVKVISAMKDGYQYKKIEGEKYDEIENEKYENV